MIIVVQTDLGDDLESVAPNPSYVSQNTFAVRKQIQLLRHYKYELY